MQKKETFGIDVLETRVYLMLHEQGLQDSRAPASEPEQLARNTIRSCVHETELVRYVHRAVIRSRRSAPERH